MAKVKIQGAKYSDRYSKAEIAKQKLDIMNDEFITHAAIIRNKKTGVEHLIAGDLDTGRAAIRHLITEVTVKHFEDPKTGQKDIVSDKDFVLVEQWKGDCTYKEEHELSIAELVAGEFDMTIDEIREKLKK